MTVRGGGEGGGFFKFTISDNKSASLYSIVFLHGVIVNIERKWLTNCMQ